MKKVFVFILMCMVVAVAARAQVVNTEALTTDTAAVRLQPDSVTPDGEWQKVVETTLKAQEAYKAARSVLARMVPKYQQRVQLEDAQDCKIICDMALELLGSYRSKGKELYTGIYQTTMTFAFKDGRYKVKADGVTCDYVIKHMGDTMGGERGASFRTTDVKTDGGLRRDMQMKAGLFLKAFKTALEKQKAEDDF